jgi:hypothetical protein
MEGMMYSKSNITCPHLIMGNSEGASCSVFNSFIRDMEDADIMLCMDRHYEACSIYISSLIKMAVKPFLSEHLDTQ